MTIILSQHELQEAVANWAKTKTGLLFDQDSVTFDNAGDDDGEDSYEARIDTSEG